MKLNVLGRSAYVYTAGHALNTALPTIVFIHGGEQDHSAWALQSRYFAYHGRNVLVPDLPGHGRSAGPALGSIAELAGWIANRIDPAMPVAEENVTALAERLAAPLLGEIEFTVAPDPQHLAALLDLSNLA